MMMLFIVGAFPAWLPVYLRAPTVRKGSFNYTKYENVILVYPELVEGTAVEGSIKNNCHCEEALGRRGNLQSH